MKKLPTSCALVVFLAVLAYQVRASIVVLTGDTRTQSTPNTMQGNRLAEYDQTTLFSDKDLFAINEILGAVYVRNNDNIIQPTTSGVAYIGLTFKDTYVPDYDLITNIATLFFDEDLFAGNQLIDMVYIPGNNIIPSAALDAALGSLTFENKSPIEYNHPTNITALHLGESIFANIGTFYITSDSFVIPEPSPIAILGLGSLYLLRKRKGVWRAGLCACPEKPHRVVSTRMK